MSTYKIKCPKCKEEFTKKCIILIEKNKKEIKDEAKVTVLAESVKKLFEQISTKPIDIEKITIIAANREEQLQRINDSGTSLEVTIVPGLEPK